MDIVIDNNIQVYRTMSSWWKDFGCDSVFNNTTPIVTDYLLMEYRKTVIDSMHLLIDLINDIPQELQENGLRNRLGELLQKIATPKIFLTPRKKNLILSVLGYFIIKNPEFLYGLNKSQFIDILNLWSDTLETKEFYEFVINGKVVNIKQQKLFIDLFSCPLSRRGNKITCRKNENTCNVIDIINTHYFSQLIKIAKENNIKEYHQLKEIATIGKKLFKNGRSIGQRRCFKISDLFHAVTCLWAECGIVTSDRSLKILSDLAQIPTKYFELKSKKIID